jgi:hypothetical protein
MTSACGYLLATVLSITQLSLCLGSDVLAWTGHLALGLLMLCRYASDINSPLRHVRTRIYFTSESHIHSLINVLR